MIRISILFITMVLFPLPLWALETGDVIPSLSLNDQFDEAVTLTDDTRYLLFVSGRSLGDQVHDFVVAQPEGFLQQQSMVYVADISRMPSLITSMFAIPAMQDYPYSMALLRDEQQLTWMPRKENHMTLLVLSNQQLQEQHYFADTKALAKFFTD